MKTSQKALVALAAAALATMQCMATDSAAQKIVIDNMRTPFWRTAFSSTETLALDFPDGANSASLTVTAANGYSATYSNLTGNGVTVNLPNPVSPETERVYTLTLTYSDGTVRTATLARVLGAAQGDTADNARCIPDESNRRWSRFHRFAVLPVPYGATSLSIDGATVATGLDGAAGWYGLGPVAAGETKTLQLVEPAGTSSATLLGTRGDGIVINVN